MELGGSTLGRGLSLGSLAELSAEQQTGVQLHAWLHDTARTATPRPTPRDATVCKRDPVRRSVVPSRDDRAMNEQGRVRAPSSVSSGPGRTHRSRWAPSLLHAQGIRRGVAPLDALSSTHERVAIAPALREAEVDARHLVERRKLPHKRPRAWHWERRGLVGGAYGHHVYMHVYASHAMLVSKEAPALAESENRVSP